MNRIEEKLRSFAAELNDLELQLSQSEDDSSNQRCSDASAQAASQSFLQENQGIPVAGAGVHSSKKEETYLDLLHHADSLLSDIYAVLQWTEAEVCSLTWLSVMDCTHLYSLFVQAKAATNQAFHVRDMLLDDSHGRSFQLGTRQPFPSSPLKSMDFFTQQMIEGLNTRPAPPSSPMTARSTGRYSKWGTSRERSGDTARSPQSPGGRRQSYGATSISSRSRLSARAAPRRAGSPLRMKPLVQEGTATLRPELSASTLAQGLSNLANASMLAGATPQRHKGLPGAVPKVVATGDGVLIDDPPSSLSLYHGTPRRRATSSADSPTDAAGADSPTHADVASLRVSVDNGPGTSMETTSLDSSISAFGLENWSVPENPSPQGWAVRLGTPYSDIDDEADSSLGSPSPVAAHPAIHHAVPRLNLRFRSDSPEVLTPITLGDQASIESSIASETLTVEAATSNKKGNGTNSAAATASKQLPPRETFPIPREHDEAKRTNPAARSGNSSKPRLQRHHSEGPTGVGINQGTANFKKALRSARLGIAKAGANNLASNIQGGQGGGPPARRRHPPVLASSLGVMAPTITPPAIEAKAKPKRQRRRKKQLRTKKSKVLTTVPSK